MLNQIQKPQQNQVVSENIKQQEKIQSIASRGKSNSFTITKVSNQKAKTGRITTGINGYSGR